MIDTGGQPEYMVNMPIFILFCHLVFIVFNLLFRVDDFPPMHYHEEGKTFNRKLTVLQQADHPEAGLHSASQEILSQERPVLPNGGSSHTQRLCGRG